MDGTHPTGMHSCYNLFLKNYLMINYQATRNLLGHPDLQSWVPGWATAKKFLNHRLRGGGRAWQILRDTVNDRAVRILLECILVST